MDVTHRRVFEQLHLQRCSQCAKGMLTILRPTGGVKGFINKEFLKTPKKS
jgi:hypothetical protein